MDCINGRVFVPISVCLVERVSNPLSYEGKEAMTQEEKDKIIENIREQHEKDLESLIEYLERVIVVDTEEL